LGLGAEGYRGAVVGCGPLLPRRRGPCPLAVEITVVSGPGLARSARPVRPRWSCAKITVAVRSRVAAGHPSAARHGDLGRQRAAPPSAILDGLCCQGGS